MLIVSEPASVAKSKDTYQLGTRLAFLLKALLELILEVHDGLVNNLLELL